MQHILAPRLISGNTGTPHEFTERTTKDNAFVVTFHRGEIYRVQLAKSPSGDYLANASMFANGFNNPLDITVGPDGNLYIADWGDDAIYRISYSANSAGS